MRSASLSKKLRRLIFNLPSLELTALKNLKYKILHISFIVLFTYYTYMRTYILLLIWIPQHLF